MPGKNKNDDGNTKTKKGAAKPEEPHFRAMAMTDTAPGLAFGKQETYESKSVGAVTPDYRTDIDPPKTFIRKENGWDEPNLTPVGLYYPLGPCQKRLAKNKLGDVLETLRRVFCTLSLHTRYQNSPISAECKSLDQVVLDVVVFAARDDSEQIIVEVCKREGDSYSFHLYAQQILASITGHSSAEPVVRSSWNLEALSQADSVGESQDSIVEALEIAWSMLSSERYDARRLSLESLTHMTDPNKSGWSTSKAISQCLLDPKGAIQERLSKAVLELASLDTSSSDVVESDSYDLDSPSFEDAAEDDFAYLGLIIMSNALQVAAGAKTLDVVKTFLEVRASGLVGCIMNKVGDVQQRPHHAYYAVRSLAALCESVPAVRSSVSSRDVEEAQLVGESSHFALATATQKLLVSLQA